MFGQRFLVIYSGVLTAVLAHQMLLMRRWANI